MLCIHGEQCRCGETDEQQVERRKRGRLSAAYLCTLRNEEDVRILPVEPRAVQPQSSRHGTRVPGSVAIAHVLLSVWGSVIVSLMHVGRIRATTWSSRGSAA